MFPELIWKNLPKNSNNILLSTVGMDGPKGLHSLCSWVIGSRLVSLNIIPHNTCWGDSNKLPNTVFVGCDSFKLFYNKVLSLIQKNHKFILIIA